MKNGGRILLNAIAICEMFKTSWEKTERRFGEAFKGPIIPFGARVEYHPIQYEINQDFISLARRSYLGFYSDLHRLQGRIWKGDVSIEELGKLDASEIHARRLNAKEITTSKRGDNFICPFADGTAKLCGRPHEVRESTPRQYQLVGSEDLREQLEETRRGLNQQKQKRTRKPETISGRFKRLHLSSSC